MMLHRLIADFGFHIISASLETLTWFQAASSYDSLPVISSAQLSLCSEPEIRNGQSETLLNA